MERAGTAGRSASRRVDNDIVVIDSEEEVEILDDHPPKAPTRCVSLLDSSDEENHENRSRHRKRQKTAPPSEEEAADGELAERLQREENIMAAKRANENDCDRDRDGFAKKARYAAKPAIAHRQRGIKSERSDRALAKRLQKEERAAAWRANGDDHTRDEKKAGFATKPAIAQQQRGKKSERSDRALAERLQKEERVAARRANGTRVENGRKAGLASNETTIVSRRRELDRRLREEQDREYEETMVSDQIKEFERREVETTERLGREESEEAAQLETAKRASVLNDAREAMERTGGEPPANDARGVARLRFALPSGKKVDRRFLAVDTVASVRAFLVVHFHEQGEEVTNVGLATNYPKREFGKGEEKLSLVEAGLAPQAVVMVQDLDA